MTEIESMSEEQGAVQAPPQKRAVRRRPTKKAESEIVVDAAMVEMQVAENNEVIPAVADESTAEKAPKRRVRSRKTNPATKEDAPVAAAEGEAASAIVEAPSVESTDGAVASESAQDKPRRRPARTKRAPKADKVIVEEPALVAEVANADEPARVADEKAEQLQPSFLDQPVREGEGVEVAFEAAAPAESFEAPESSEMHEANEASEASESGEAVQAEQGEGEASETGRRPRRSVKAGRPIDRQEGDEQRADQKRQKHGKKEQRDEKREKHDKHEKRSKRDRGNRNKEVAPSLSLDDLAELKVADLRAKAAELELDATGMKKADLVQAVYEANLKAEGFVQVAGVLDVMPDGYGFLRTQGYLPSETDCYVGLSLIRRNGLRKGDMVVGQTRPARDNEKYAAIQKIITVNDKPIEEMGSRVRFADLTPVYPDERLLMEHGKNTITARVIDLAAPIGKGQRGLIVSPPKAGKTTILKDIAAAISANNPEVHLMCLLVDERPEEVTDMQRSIKGEVISSTFDMPSENHIAVAELVIERAKRMVEDGKDVVILLDSLTRLARAYNLAQPASGRILSGGVDSTALYPPKRFLGAARNIENGGSLTILASALIDTGSKMDEVIFEEFKGTGNMELKLDRFLADRRIFPAIDPVQSGTRKEDLLLNPQEAPLIWAVRRILANMNNTERAMDMLIKSLKQTDNNQEFLIRTAKKAQHNTKGEGITEF